MEAIYKASLFTESIISLKVKSESYNDEARIKVVANAFQTLDFKEESKQLIQAIQAYN